MSSHQNPVPFAKALYRMINEHPETISWDSSTGSIVIPDPKALEKTLVEYFRHGRYASFQRQLNNFGYRRVGSPGQATVYRRWATNERDTDMSKESILSLRHVLRRSCPPPQQQQQQPTIHRPHPDFLPSRRPVQHFHHFQHPPQQQQQQTMAPRFRQQQPHHHQQQQLFHQHVQQKQPAQKQQQQQHPLMPPPRLVERHDSLSSLFNQPPSFAARALLSLKAQPV